MLAQIAGRLVALALALKTRNTLMQNLNYLSRSFYSASEFVQASRNIFSCIGECVKDHIILMAGSTYAGTV